MKYAPIEAKTNLKKFLKKKGYGRYLNKIILDAWFVEPITNKSKEVKAELQLQSTTEEKKTIGKITHKLYKCIKCGHEQLQGTNHWGQIYSDCPKCQWKRPMEMGSVWECQEPIPDGYSKPEPWVTVKLGNVIKSIEKEK